MKLRPFLFAFPLLATALHAANITWNTGGPSNTWDTSTANWTGDATVFTNGDNVTFNAATGETVTVAGGGVTPTATTVSNNGNWTFDGGSIAGGTLTKSGTGVLTLSAANSFTSITVTGAGPAYGYDKNFGALKFANGNALGSGTIDFSGATASLNGLYSTATTTVTNKIVLPTTSGVNFGFQNDNTATATYSGVISGGHASNVIIFSGDNTNPTQTIKLTNLSNTFKGTLDVQRGVLAITSDGVLGDAANLIRFDQGGTNGFLRFDANNINVAHALYFKSASGFNINGYDATISGAITGGSLGNGIIGGTLSGGNSSGSLTISGSNTNSGAYSIAADTKLIAASVNALGTGTKTVVSGATVAFKNVGTYTGSGGINLNGTGTQVGGAGVGALENVSGNNTFNNAITLQSASTIGVTADSLSLGGNVTGAFALTKIGSGKLTLAGTNNSYSGGTTWADGDLSITNGTGLGTAALTITKTSAGTFNVANNAATTVANDIILPAPVNATTYSIVKNSSSKTSGTQLDLTGTISGGNANTTLFLNSNTGSDDTTTYRFAGNNTFVGSINLNRGAIVVTNANSLGAATNKIILNGNNNMALGDLRFQNSMTLANPIELRSGNGPIGTSANDVTLSGVLSGAVGITKLGVGTLTVTNSNTYSGSTVVSEGTLLVNGSLASTATTTVATGATLGGTGSIAGAVNVTGVLSPGASIQSLGTGALTMNSGSTFVFEASNNTNSGADLLVALGNLSLTGVTLDLSTANLGLGTWALGDKLTLISYTGTGITSGFTGYIDDTSYNFGANEWLFDYNDAIKGNNFNSEATGTSFVTMTLVPEPSVMVLGSLSLLALLRRRRA